MHALQRLALVAAGAAIFSTACHADDASDAPASPTRCELHEPHAAVLDPRELALRTSHPSDLVRVCTTPGRKPAYSVVTVPAHLSPELCRYTETPSDATHARPATYVRQERGLCPPPEPADYFAVDDVPDDALRRLLALQHEMAASDAGFDKAAKSLDPVTSPRGAAQFEQFRQAMRSGVTRVAGVERVGPHDEPRGGFFLTLYDTSSPSTTWRLGVVPTGGRLLLRRLDEGAID